MLLRRMEMDVNSLVGLSGSFFAARRAQSPSSRTGCRSDFCTLFASVRAGLRGVADEGLTATTPMSRIRQASSDARCGRSCEGMTAFFAAHDLLNPFRHPLFSWQFVSHKFVRWTVPFAMLAALGTSGLLALMGVPFFLAAFGMQAAVYLYSRSRRSSPASIDALGRTAHYFVIVNLSILVAWMRYLGGERVVTWNPSAR